MSTFGISEEEYTNLQKIGSKITCETIKEQFPNLNLINYCKTVDRRRTYWNTN